MSDKPELENEVSVHAEVYTHDGHHLGKVKEVAVGYFQVDVRFHGDYWLQKDFIESSTPEKVTMTFNNDEAKHYHVLDLPTYASPDGPGVNPYPENAASAVIREAGHPRDR